MSPTTREALKVHALMAHVPGAAVHHRRRLLLLPLLRERVHVAAQGHCGAALGGCLCLLGRWGGNAVFGEGLQRPLGSELGVVVESEDGGFVGLWCCCGGCELLLLLRLRGLLLELLLGLHLLLVWHARLLWSKLGLPERVLRSCGRERRRLLLLRNVRLRLEILVLRLHRCLDRRTEEIFLLAVYGLRRL